MTSRSAARPSAVLLQYLSLALVWGTSFLFIAIALRGLSPAQIAFGRLAIGALVLWLSVAVARQVVPRELRVWAHLWVVGLFLCAVPFVLFAYAQQHVSSGLASIYNATTPLMTALVALLALRQQRTTSRQMLGLLIGFAGVLTVIGPALTTPGADPAGSLRGQLACLGATACYGIALVYTRRFITPLGYPAVSTAAIQVTLAALTLLIALPSALARPVSLTPGVLIAMLCLGALGTGTAYIWNTGIIAAWGPTRGATVTYLTPLIGVLAGALVLGERVSWNQPLGAAIVVLGIVLAQRPVRPGSGARTDPAARPDQAAQPYRAARAKRRRTADDGPASIA